MPQNNSDNILQDVKKLITESDNSISPSKLITSLKDEKYSQKQIQSTIHREMDLGNIELGAGLQLKIKV